MDEWCRRAVKPAGPTKTPVDAFVLKLVTKTIFFSPVKSPFILADMRSQTGTKLPF